MPSIWIVAAAPALRAGLRALLADAGFVVAGESPVLAARDGGDVLLLNDVPPADLAAALTGRGHEAAVLLSADADRVAELRALPLRGWALLPPDVDAPGLTAAILAAHNGLAALPSAQLERALGGGSSTAAALTQDAGTEPGQTLTSREQAVLERVARGLPSKLIAGELGLSESTVKAHLSAIYGKLGASSRAEAVSKAARRGLITL
jgi:DNA-binding NarL/FixJ family response regulator